MVKLIMDNLDQEIARWKESLCKEISRDSLFSKNPIAYKWKALYRSLVIREVTLWRITDLMEQAKLLIDNNHILGARILIRSGIETAAVLIYLNQKTNQVIREDASFHQFSDITAKLLLGSKDRSTKHISINILTILEKSNTDYPGILKAYEKLSESTHPNWEGLYVGYAKVNHEENVTNFKNRWVEVTEDEQVKLMEALMAFYKNEYQEVWPCLMEEMEKWIEENNISLEQLNFDT